MIYFIYRHFIFNVKILMAITSLGYATLDLEGYIFFFNVPVYMSKKIC